MSRAAIQARRAALATQAEQAKQQYAELQATLHELDRQICGMHGGIQELDALLALPEDSGLLIRSATARLAQASEMIASYQGGEIIDIENTLSGAHTDMLEWLTTYGAPCDSPASSS
jgi:hypothetical protein